jgi:hypothetical protein
MLRLRRRRLGTTELVADVVDVAVDLRAPSLKLSNSLLHRFHPVVALVADLGQPDELEVAHALFQVGDSLVEVRPPVVGDDGG